MDTIFSILSDSLPQKLKAQIFNIINDSSIYSGDRQILLNYINSLVDIYEEQSKNVNNIEKFVFTCNKYLHIGQENLTFPRVLKDLVLVVGAKIKYYTERNFRYE